jgi:2-iminobutanoate/2-iminopropanoate deaminase
MMQPIQRVAFPGGNSQIPVATEVNGLIFARGLLPIRYDNPRAQVPEGIEQQTALVLNHAKTLLKQMTLTEDRLLAVSIGLSNLARDYERMDRVYRASFGNGALAARSCAGVVELPGECLIQLDFTAAR